MRVIEYWYPYILSLIVACTVFFFGIKISSINNLSDVLNSLITFSSIVIAFLATMLTILITITNSKAMKMIKEEKYGDDLTNYIKTSIIVGFALTFYSILMHVFTPVSDLVSMIAFSILLFLVTLFVTSSYRIINIFSNILKSVLKESSSSVVKNHVPIVPRINKDHDEG